jgi:hypothetical protein
MSAPKEHKNVKRVLVLVMLVAMLLPALQQFFHFAFVKELNGYFEPAEAPEWSADNWFSGRFQEQADPYLNENFGFRSDFVRIRNQIEFSMYERTHTTHVSAGINQFMYSTLYVAAYLGTDFIGTDSIVEQFDKLKMVQDTLHELGIEFVFVFAPGKASYYPEFIPRFPGDSVGPTNYHVMTAHARKVGVNILDFCAWFNAAKDTSTYPLFPKTGIHWSEYGATLAADSIIHYMESKGNFSIPDPDWDGVNITSDLNKNDRDLERAMNLFWKIPNMEMAYPIVHYPNAKDRDQEFRSLFIADSYYYQLHPHHYKLWVHAEFWYYNNAAKNLEPGKPSEVKDLDLKAELEKQDFIVILSTDAQLSRLAWGWIDDVYALYYPK